ncbi:MAG: type II secretion system protein GspD [Ignavibacteriales bacterium]|nr:type II secretion system protein GspD [Ignavibacteriales bacterium]
MKLHYSFIILLLFIPQSLLFSQQDSLKYPPNSKSIVIALNFKDSDVKDVLRSIAYEYKTNIVVDNNITTRISTALYNLDLFSVVKIIAEDNGLDFSYDNKRFIVKKKEEKILPKPEEPRPEIIYDKRKITMKLDNVDINKFVDKLRKETNKNFLVTQGTTGRLSGTLNEVELDKGLKLIFQNNGFLFTVKDSIYYISRSSYAYSTDPKNPQDKNSYWVSAENDKVSINVTETNLDKVVNDLFQQMNLQVVKLGVANVNVSLRCNDVDIDKALEYLFKGTDFTFKKDKEAYIIGNKNSKSLDNTKLVKLNYLRADKIKEKLPNNLTQQLSVNISLEHNALVLSGNYENIMSLEEYIEVMDKPVPQVMIEAIVVDYNLDNTKQFGLTAGRGDSATVSQKDKWFPGINVTASGKKINNLLNSVGNINLFGKDIDVAKLGKLPDDFYINLKALEQDGIANVKSKPILSTLNGHTASLKIGTVQNYVFNDVVPIQSTVNTNFLERERIEKIEANISFEITPWVNPNNELTLEIKPEFQTPIGDFVPDKRLIPAINTRSFFSTVRLKDGETIILGGLIQEKETNIEDKVPLLGDIPLIGTFFTSSTKKKSKGELIIYLTPRINYGEDFGFSSYNYSK